MKPKVPFCLYCPENCVRQGEHHHYPKKKFDSHPGVRLPETLGGIPDGS